MTTPDDGLTGIQRKKLSVIRKAQTLAEDPGATAAEQQAAATRAAELMAAYAITEDMLTRAADGERPEQIITWKWTDVPGSGGHGRARTTALSTLAAAADCEAVVYTVLRGKQGHPQGGPAGNLPRDVEFLGHELDIAVLRSLVPYLTVTWENAARTAARERTRQMREKNKAYIRTYGHYDDDVLYTPAEINTAYAATFRARIRGYAAGVAERLKERRPQLIADATAETATGEIVLAGRAALVSARYATLYPNLGPVSTEEIDRKEFQRGVREGYQAGLPDRQVSA